MFLKLYKIAKTVTRMNKKTRPVTEEIKRGVFIEAQSVLYYICCQCREDNPIYSNST
ncbi:hypothetical protein E2C01_000155 [Portunus trituberculatus]|uniref:Uncharacterized protein n=1 Tax=Portunus trituberculatus TaxID=210409 RepID=A0A5B7CFS2_PORTR|nr:hypothetical protein [Portunus trituberculatus]